MSIKPIGGIILRKGSKKGSYNFPKNSPNLDSLILGTQEVKKYIIIQNNIFELKYNKSENCT